MQIKKILTEEREGVGVGGGGGGGDWRPQNFF